MAGGSGSVGWRLPLTPGMSRRPGAATTSISMSRNWPSTPSATLLARAQQPGPRAMKLMRCSRSGPRPDVSVAERPPLSRVHEQWPLVLLLITSGGVKPAENEIFDKGHFLPKPYTGDDRRPGARGRRPREKQRAELATRTRGRRKGAPLCCFQSAMGRAPNYFSLKAFCIKRAREGPLRC